MVNEFDVSKELEKLEQKILESVKIEDMIVAGLDEIHIRTAHKIRLVIEYFDEEMMKFFKKKEVENEKEI